jgi:hypothetical protein
VSHEDNKEGPVPAGYRGLERLSVGIEHEVDELLVTLVRSRSHPDPSPAEPPYRWGLAPASPANHATWNPEAVLA